MLFDSWTTDPALDNAESAIHEFGAEVQGKT